ncbi:MAG: DUF4810 domain-containing protein [Puniceicoccaceae bacterium]
MRIVAISASFLLFLSGCQSIQPLYHWGSYEPLTYAALVKSEKVSLEEQRLHLEHDLEVARAKDRSIPPGMCAYLAYLCLNLGDDESAHAYFEQEKASFPESTAFIDRLMQHAFDPASPQP